MGRADEDSLPVGLQFLAPQKADDRLYNAGAALERLLEEKWGGQLLAQAPELEVAR
jgi:aspartyl-tRNA(Asn)/glutamyl-tRNA(Gln) amidotransferase subunit A